MIRTRGSRSVNACASYSRSKTSRPRADQRRERVVAELREADDAEAPAVQQRLDVLDEVAVVADQQHVVVPVAPAPEGPLDRDVDDLLVGRRRPAGPAGSPSTSSACTNDIGSSLLAARKNSPTGGWPQRSRANSSSRSQRGRSSGRGRRPRIDAPRVASMFSPSTSRYVVPVRVPPSLMPGRYGGG